MRYEVNCLRCQELEKVLSNLIDCYVANIGTESEFISCITPKPAYDMTFLERKRSSTWTLWDNARILLGGKYITYNSKEKPTVNAKEA